MLHKQSLHGNETNPQLTNKGVKKSVLAERLPSNPSVGIDYLFATSKDRWQIDAWYSIFRRYADELEANKFLNLKKGHWRGYATEQLPGLSIGIRSSDCMIRASGSVCSSVFSELAKHCTKITRIDIQATYNLAKPMPDLAQRCFEYLNEEGYTRSTKSLIQSDTGQTMYLGSFNSKMFGRMYDRAKSEKLDTLGQKWRFETVWRDDKAKAVFARLRNEAIAGDDYLTTSYAILAQWWAERWLDLPGEADVQDIALDNVGVEIKTARQKLEWLKTGVRPAIHKLLLADVTEADICNALGLKPKIVTIPLENSVKDG